MAIERYLQEVPLFNDLTENEYQIIGAAAEIIRYCQNEIIIKEGELANCCYVIMAGSVQVFTTDKDNKVIILARLNEKDHFGEQAYLNNLIPAANVKALTDVELIKIGYDSLDIIFKRSNKFRKYLEHVSLERTIANLQMQLSSLNTYLKEIFAGLKQNDPQPSTTTHEKVKPFIKYLKKDEIIFNKGDPFDYVYLISYGTVSLNLEEEGNKQEYHITKNTIFGELGILENKPRAATARALTSTALLAISGEDFLKAVKHYHGVDSLRVALRNVYLLPKNQGIVKQFMGVFHNSDAIFTTYQLPLGTVICAKVVTQPIFTIKLQDVEPDHTYTFKRGKMIERTIMLKDFQIVGINVVGEWDEINILCEMLLEGIKLHFFSESTFLKSGSILNLSSNSRYYKNDTVCNCFNINYQTLKDKISQGLRRFEDISRATGVCTACGACRDKVLDILDKSSWMYASIQLYQQYSEDICAFLIKPIYGHFPTFSPGHFVSLKLQINNLWVERSYTLVSYAKNNKYYEIIVKKYSTGVFSPWLFQHKSETLFSWISQPGGNFLLPQESQKTILCFAGGIGITPFIAFIREIEKEHTQHKIFIFYAVENHNAIIIPEDVKQFLNTSNAVNIEIWETSVKGYVDEATIKQNIINTSPEYVYICGPEGFKAVIISILTKMNFNAQNILIEEFLPAGG